VSRRRCALTGGSSNCTTNTSPRTRPTRVILEAVAQSGWVLVTQDRRIRKRAAELDALIDHGVRAFFIASTANLSAAETTDVLRRAHDAMAVAVDELDAPFVVAIYKDASTRRII
jgi:PIN like domain